jgi:hypothetical protein
MPTVQAKKRAGFGYVIVSREPSFIDVLNFILSVNQHVFLANVCAQHGHLVWKIPNYSRG